MTYTEIIDNIQTRIENIISERLAGTYQHITIEPSDYNPDIDDEITVTITVLDQNDDPITNWTVPLLINGNSVSETLETDSNGQVTYDYTCNSWGVCRFSVKSFATTINITGYKTIQSSDGVVLTASNGMAQLNCNRTIGTVRSGDNSLNFTIPTGYRPNINIYLRTSASDVWGIINTNGAVSVYNTGSQRTNQNVMFNSGLYQI